MTKSLAPLRGMNDVLPDDSPWWQLLEDTARGVFEAYGFRQIRVPLLERTELFRRSIGEVTDIVEKEMYTFDDRSGDSVTLRPEATAGIVRAGISNGLLHNQQQRLWCMGPMFRYERPQKGRYRQFHQLDVEALGYPGPDIDAEMILMSARIWRELGLRMPSLEINSLGTPEARAAYREVLVDYFEARRGALDEDSVRRLGSNPMRILDSKHPDMQAVIAEAPLLTEHLDPESATHFAALRGMLDAAGIEYRVNPRLVRGLDYYSRTVFEWLTDRLGAQGAVCSGGRYDGLVSQLGGRPTPAIGWAMGVERLVELLRLDRPELSAAAADIYILVGDEALVGEGMQLAEGLRDGLRGLRVQLHCGGGSLKAQFRRADRSGARWALVLGQSELERGEVTAKPLREAGDQLAVPREALLQWLRDRLASGH
ncbi:MAG: histidine--tRNA ligase [Gammaproteobacteria bacterium]|nr:MAG: histidine--tRNA ligase [Gammaproteobacteria bacterium]